MPIKVLIAITIFTLAFLPLATFWNVHLCPEDRQWYWYFVVNDSKALLVSLALIVVTYRTKAMVFAWSLFLLCLYDVLTQALDVNVKGHWVEITYYILIGLLLAICAWKIMKK